MYSELDQFVKKFKQIWASGVDAHLHVETHAGQAQVHLQVQLGQAHGLPQQHHYRPESPLKTRNGPSRQRRQARRETARQEKAAKAGKDASEETTVNRENDFDKESEKSNDDDIKTKIQPHEKHAEEVTNNNMDNVEVRINDAEQVPSYNFENETELADIPCEKCIEIFAFHKEIKEHMCDECMLIIAQKEGIQLRNKYKCTICKEIFKT